MKILSFFLIFVWVFCLFFLPVNIEANQNGNNSVSLNLAWEDVNVKDPESFHWLLFMRGEGEQYNYDSPILTIPYFESQNANYSYETYEIKVIGPPGDKITKYFVMRSVDETRVSEDSNEVDYTFEMPKVPPYIITITFRKNPDEEP